MERCEQSIIEWYNKTRSLEYLHLFETTQPNSSELASNLEVVHNKVCLLSKVSLKHFLQLEEENKGLKRTVDQLKSAIAGLERDLVKQKSVSKEEVKTILLEVTEQTKIANEKILRESKQTKQSIQKVEELLKEIRVSLSG